jgi:cell division septation protein DedD
MDPIPDGSTEPAPPRLQLAALGSVTAMEPIVSAGDFQRRMEPVVSPGDPGTVTAEPLAPPPGLRAAPAAGPAPAIAAAPAAAPGPRGGFSLIPSAQAGTLPVRPRPAAPTPITLGGAWGVQVGAFGSENLARSAALQARDLIGARGARTVVERVTQGRTTLYRARVVGLADRASADQACTRLRGRGACMIVAPGA